MAQVFNLAVDQGADFSAEILASDDTGTARDLTGYTGRGQMRRSYYSTSNVAFTVTIPTPETGEVQITLTNATTANLRMGRYVYDIELVKTADGTVERLLEGIVTVYPEVTR